MIRFYNVFSIAEQDLEDFLSYLISKSINSKGDSKELYSSKGSSVVLVRQPNKDCLVSVVTSDPYLLAGFDTSATLKAKNGF